MVTVKDFLEIEPKELTTYLLNQNISTINKIKTLLSDELWDSAMYCISNVMAEGKQK